MAFLREIVSYHGTVLAVQAKTGTVVNCAEAAIGSSCARIVAIVPEKESGVCFLVPKFPVEPVLQPGWRRLPRAGHSAAVHRVRNAGEPIVLPPADWDLMPSRGLPPLTELAG